VLSELDAPNGVVAAVIAEDPRPRLRLRGGEEREELLDVQPEGGAIAVRGTLEPARGQHRGLDRGLEPFFNMWGGHGLSSMRTGCVPQRVW